MLHMTIDVYIMLYTTDNKSLKYFNLNSLGEFTVIPKVL